MTHQVGPNEDGAWSKKPQYLGVEMGLEGMYSRDDSPNTKHGFNTWSEMLHYLDVAVGVGGM